MDVRYSFLESPPIVTVVNSSSSLSIDAGTDVKEKATVCGSDHVSGLQRCQEESSVPASSPAPILQPDTSLASSKGWKQGWGVMDYSYYKKNINCNKHCNHISYFGGGGGGLITWKTLKYEGKGTYRLWDYRY